MPRQEHKFILTPAQADAVREMILPHVELDAHAAQRPRQEYTVRSLYLDCCRLRCYHEKQAGLKDRVKFRVRGYNDITADSPIYLEIKKKTGQAIVKRRSSLRYGDLRLFLETQDAGRFIRGTETRTEALANAAAFLYCAERRALGPVVVVAYEREAFFSRHGVALRITVDKNLRTHPPAELLSSPHNERHRCVLGQRVILEVKSEFGFPLWLRAVLSRIDVRHVALSKYTICVDCLTASGYRCAPMPWWAVTVAGSSTTT